MKILHLITSLDLGGAESMLFRLLENRSASDIEHVVLSLRGPGVFGARLEAFGIEVHAMEIARAIDVPSAFMRARKIAVDSKADLLQTWLHHADLFGSGLAYSGLDIPLVWNLRCADLGVKGMPARNRRLAKFLSRLSKQPTCVIANSFAGKHAHAAIGYHPRRWEVIGNGFDLKLFRPDPAARLFSRAMWGVGDSVPVIGMVGRYHAVKGFPTFTRAAAILRRQYPAVRFVLAGSGLESSNREMVELLHREGIADATILLGPQQDVPAVMNGLDLLASCSTTEGFPNVVAESMACGVPCVATNAGDSALIVEDSERIVGIGNAEEMAAGWARVLALGPETSWRLRERVRKQIASRYDIGVVTLRYEQLYRDLVEESAS